MLSLCLPSPLSALYTQPLGCSGKASLPLQVSLLPSVFPRGSAFQPQSLLFLLFGRNLSAVVSLTTNSRIGYFPWSPWVPLSRPDTLPSPSLGKGTISVSQQNFVGTGLSRERSDFGDGEENSVSISLGICPGDTMSLAGLGLKRHSAETPEGGVHSPGHRLQNMLLLATSSNLLGKGSLDQILFFSLGLMCKAPWVRIKGWYLARWQGLKLGRDFTALEEP